MPLLNMRFAVIQLDNSKMEFTVSGSLSHLSSLDAIKVAQAVFNIERAVNEHCRATRLHCEIAPENK